MDTFHTVLYSIVGVCVILITALAIFLGSTKPKNAVINWMTNPVANKRARREKN